MNNTEALKYPVGKFTWPDEISRSDITKWINIIEMFPSGVIAEVSGLNDNELDWRYRPDGWSIRQVVHHCADSHYNSFVRFKLALTEHSPTIKPYDEAEWAKLTDSLGPIDSSISILQGLHNRWCRLLKSLDKNMLEATYFHPEQKATRKLEETIALYAWHCDHHLGHIRLGKNAKGKYN